MNPEYKNILLTLGLTTCYKTDVSKLESMIHSLFSSNGQLLESLKCPYNYITNLNQKVELFVVIDDNPKIKETSTNQIIELLSKLNNLLNKYVIIRYVVTKTNIGVSCARNIIIKEAIGKYICFCDDDDLRCNIVKLLEIIKEYYDEDYISHYVQNNSMEKIDLKLLPRISNISVWNGIIKTKFLRSNKLYLTPNLATEDVIWRSNLNYLMSVTNFKSSQIDDVCYIYCEQSNRSLNHSEVNSRFLDKININNKFILNKTNDDYYEGVNKILSQQIDIGFKLTDWRIFGITSSLTFYKQHNIIREWLNNNIDLLSEGYDLEMLKLTNEMNEVEYTNLFTILTDSDKRLCLKLYTSFATIPDLYSFSKHIDSNITLDILDNLWTNSLFYKLYEHQIASFEPFNDFVYRFIHLMWLRKPNKYYKKYIDEEIIDKLLELYNNEFSEFSINEPLNYIHDKLCIKNIKSNIYNYFSNQTTSFETINEDLKEMLDDIKDKKVKDYVASLIDEFVVENTIDTANFNKNFNYKGPLNVFVFYILSSPLVNPLKKIPKPLLNINYFGNTVDTYEDSNIKEESETSENSNQSTLDEKIKNKNYEIKFIDKYYEHTFKINHKSITKSKYEKLTQKFTKSEIILLINLHNYTYTTIDELLSKIDKKYLLKFTYHELMYLINNKINLKIFDYESTYLEDRLLIKSMMKLIGSLNDGKLNWNEQLDDSIVEFINSIKYLDSKIITRILTFNQLGFKLKEIKDELDKQITSNVKYSKFKSMDKNYKLFFDIKVDVHNKEDLYSETYLNLKFIHHMITSCNKQKHGYRSRNIISKYRNYFEEILNIIDMFNTYNLNILDYDYVITSIDELRYDLLEEIRDK